jgi:hypothetical protein
MPQTKAQLKALRKKYHLGEFRNSKSKKSKSIKHNRRYNMARKKRTSHRRSGLGTSSIMSTAVGVGGFCLYESLLEPKVAATIGQGMVLNVAELATGMWLSKKSGIVGNIGKAAVVLSAYKIVKPLLANVAGSASY